MSFSGVYNGTVRYGTYSDNGTEFGCGTELIQLTVQSSANSTELIWLTVRKLVGWWVVGGAGCGWWVAVVVCSSV